jgi:hypothetical protein
LPAVPNLMLSSPPGAVRAVPPRIGAGFHDSAVNRRRGLLGRLR